MVRIAELDPSIVWGHFQTLCDIARPSKGEEALRDHLQAWAQARGLVTALDRAGNLIVRKPATPGFENRVGVVLQGHLDMVCQANTGTVHDFTRDPIRPVLKDGWLVAENTTLGADNGIGVALALAALSDDTLAHGPLEVLMTLDEEAGMGGALGLEPGLLQGQMMINIDTEEWGEFYMGCAGGVDVNVHRAWRSVALPGGHILQQISVSGLVGGHSGADIHRGRGNAIKVLIRFLHEHADELGLRVVSLKGGTARNALAREAFAVVACPLAKGPALAQALADYEALVRTELAGVDDAVCVRPADIEASAEVQVMHPADQHTVLDALQAAPHGVKRMSTRVSGVVETSNNLGVVSLGEGRVDANLMVRSLLDSGYHHLAREIQALFRLAGFETATEGSYPGWAPNPDSRLLALFQRVFEQTFAQPSAVQVIHAGLECGIIGAKYPDMDMVSFGPNIRGAHAPGERVEVASVGQAWTLLKAVLGAVPVKG